MVMLILRLPSLIRTVNISHLLSGVVVRGFGSNRALESRGARLILDATMVELGARCFCVVAEVEYEV